MSRLFALLGFVGFVMAFCFLSAYGVAQTDNTFRVASFIDGMLAVAAGTGIWDCLAGIYNRRSKKNQSEV